jgi:phosphoglycolate phosphatase
MIGIPLQKSLGMFVFQENEVESDLYLNTIRSFRTYYAEKGIYESQLYHHVPEILAELSEFKDLYLVTAKPKELAIEMLKHHKLDCYFQAVGGFEGQPEFAKSRLIESFLHDDNATMIGDKAEDIIAGKDKGLKTVAALYGYGNKRELESVKPDFFIDSPTQLLTLF